MNETELFLEYLLSGDPMDFEAWRDIYLVQMEEPGE